MGVEDDGMRGRRQGGEGLDEGGRRLQAKEVGPELAAVGMMIAFGAAPHPCPLADAGPECPALFDRGGRGGDVDEASSDLEPSALFRGVAKDDEVEGIG